MHVRDHRRRPPTLDPGRPGSRGARGRPRRRMGAVDKALRGVPGVLALLQHDGLADDVAERITRFEGWIATTEAELDAGSLALSGTAVEDVNAAMVALKDAVWAVGH